MPGVAGHREAVTVLAPSIGSFCDPDPLARRSLVHLAMRYGLVSVLVVLSAVLWTASAFGLEAGQAAPDIGRADLSGAPVELARLRGKVVVVDFWASWCGPCARAMPTLERLHQRYREHGLVVLGVTVDQELPNARAFLHRTPVSFPIVHDAGQRLAAAYRPPRMPSTFIIDRGGVVRHIHAGYRDGDEARIEQEIRALLR